MAETTGIEWADRTANIWIGCTKVSAGCDHCYAERDWSVNGRRKRVTWGPHGDRSPVKRGPADIWKWHKRALKNRGVDPDLGRRARVFINSLGDIFDNHKSITKDMRFDAFALMEASFTLDFMLVTKRPQNVMSMVPAHWLRPGGWPAHVWLYVSTENQEEAERRIPILLDLPGIAVRGISAGPLLGPLDVRNLHLGNNIYLDALTGYHHASLKFLLDDACGTRPLPPMPILPKQRAKLSHVIVEGESGDGARKMKAEWARKLRDDCASTWTPFFFKQWGQWLPTGQLNARGEVCTSPHGWERSSPKANGNFLDGVQHLAMPAGGAA